MLWTKVKQSKGVWNTADTRSHLTQGRAASEETLKEGARSASGEAALQQTQNLIFVFEEQGG